MNYKPYKHLPPFKGMVLQNFPFIEEDFDAITNYQLLCKIVEYLRNVIANELTMEENVTNLYNEFVNLKNYVDNYFANLDVQEEINNKLDEMVEDGTLLNIITNYTSITKIYNTTVELLEDTNVLENQKVKTLGYYEINDGGGAEYIIDSENKPQMIIKDNTVNILSLGARKYDNNTKYDIKEYIQKYLELNSLYNYTLKLYIPAGVYHLSPLTISELYGFYIYGDNSFMLSNCGSNTVITTLNDNQDFLLNIGDTTGYTQNWTLKDITFSSAEYNYSNGRYKFNTRKSVNTFLTNFNNATFGKLNNIFYIHVNGGCLNIGSMWEVYSDIINFRDVNAVNKSIMNFSQPDLLLLNTANQSALTFENLMFEQVMGYLINIAGGSKVGNTIINNINFEDYIVNWENFTTSTINDDNRSTIESDETIHQAIINFEHTDGISQGPTGRIIINNILCNNLASHYTTYNNNNYVYDMVVKNIGNYNALTVLIDNLENIGMNMNARLLYSRGNTYQSSMFKLNKCINSSKYDFTFDIDNFTYIECDTRITGINNTKKFHLLNNITPAYKLVNNLLSGNRYLKSDSECLNNNKIAIDVKTTSPNITFIMNSRNLIIRAKVPDGETALLYIGGNHAQTLSLVGTGNYEIYEFTIEAQFPIGDIINLNFQKANTATSCLIDYIIN